MNKHSFSRPLIVIVSAVIVLFLLLGAFGGVLVLASYVNQDVQAAPEFAQPVEVEASQAGEALQQAVQTGDPLAAYEQAMTELYQTAVPSVVNVQVTQKVDGSNFHDFGAPSPFQFPSPEGEEDLPRQQEPPEDFFRRGQGSGFVWDEEGHIVTNYHVVANATQVQVVFADDTVYEAEVVGTDPNADLAVLKVDASAETLQPLPRGDSSELQVGQIVVAIGNPFGQDFTLTSGIVSAVGRTMRSGNSAFSVPEVIQTDAAINPGNSGGPLIDRMGQVIGINTQILSRSGSNAGVGFAVPVNIAERVVPTLIRGEEFEYAWLGISGSTLVPEVADLMDISEGSRGVLVAEVTRGGPADEAGLEGSGKRLTTETGEEYQLGGDVITAINDEPIESMDELIAYLVDETEPGDEVTLDLIRSDGDEETVTVTLGSRPGAEEMLSLNDEDNEE